jgi:hypothetical protein
MFECGTFSAKVPGSRGYVLRDMRVDVFAFLIHCSRSSPSLENKNFMLKYQGHYARWAYQQNSGFTGD